MANDLTQNPLIIDTASANTIVNESFLITKILWDNSGGDIAPGDQAIIKDKAGKTLYQQTVHDIGTANNVLAQPLPADFNRGLHANGLAVTALTHGKLFIYYEGKCPLS